jgi:hypothetical protein
MKFVLLLSTLVIFSFFQSNAQSSTGFYVGAHLSMANIQSNMADKRLDFKGDLGYMYGQKFRHNIQLTNLNANFNRFYKSASIGLKYQLDILIVQKNASRFYITPFVNFNYFTSRYYVNTQQDSTSQFIKANGYSYAFGIEPKYEHKVNEHITLMASMPIQIFGQQFSKNNNNPIGSNNQSKNIYPSLGFNFGIRYNFKKSK